MRKLAIGLLLFIGLSVMHGQAAAVTRYVGFGGQGFPIDTDNDCASRTSPCATLQHAVDESNEGDTLYMAGSFTDAVNISKAMDIIGRRSDFANPFSACSGDACPVLTSPTSEPAITVEFVGNGGSVTIGSIRFENSTGRALELENGARANVSGCQFRNNYEGVFLGSLARLEVNFSEFIGNGGVGSDGRAITSAGANLRIENTAFIDNRSNTGAALRLQGGIDFLGITITNSTFTGNQAGNGGAIFAKLGLDNLDVLESSFVGNSSESSGGAMHVEGSFLRIEDSVFEDNESNFGGGAIEAETGATIHGTRFLNNRVRDVASVGEGGILRFSGASSSVLSDSDMIGNRAFVDSAAPPAVRGSAITLKGQGKLTVLRSTLTDNLTVGGLGSAVAVTSQTTLALENADVFKNGEVAIGAEREASIEVVDSEIFNHTIAGIRTSSTVGSALEVTRSTIAESGFGIQAMDPGAGVVLVNSTLSNNATNLSVVGETEIVYSTLAMSTSRSLLAGGTAQVDISQSLVEGTCTVVDQASLAIDAQSYYDNASCGADAVTTLGLAPLSDNTGRSRTHALLPGSPAIDGGGLACTIDARVSALDQRGVARPFNDICDAGAFELTDADDRIFTDGFERIIKG